MGQHKHAKEKKMLILFVLFFRTSRTTWLHAKLKTMYFYGKLFNVEKISMNKTHYKIFNFKPPYSKGV
jgi:hypothetical protein